MQPHLLIGEVAPAVPLIEITLRFVLIPLLLLCSYLVAVGLIRLAEWVVRALFGTITGAVGWIPWANKVVAAPVHKIEQKLTHAMGRAEHKIDYRIGQLWHQL